MFSNNQSSLAFLRKIDDQNTVMHKTKHHLQLKTKQSLGQAGFGLNPEPTNNRPILSPKSTYWPLVEEPNQFKACTGQACSVWQKYFYYSFVTKRNLKLNNFS